MRCTAAVTVLLFLVLSRCQAGIERAIGRQNVVPATVCCSGIECLQQDRGRYAFVTIMRTSNYLPLLAQLQCSLRKHNPGARLITLAAAGDLPNATITQIKELAEYREADDLSINDWNVYFERFKKNWFKLRIWGLIDFDAIIYLDLDTSVQGDLTHLFQLPTAFAWVEESGPRLDYLSGGFLFLRPCKPVEADLIGTASVDEDLKKNIALPGFAEQAFLRWYFPRWGAVSLPEIYNLHWGTFQANNFSTASGLKPLLIHFNNWINREPLMPRPGEPEWPFLCMDRPHAARLSPQQHRRHARHRHNSFEDRLQIGSI